MPGKQHEYRRDHDHQLQANQVKPQTINSRESKSISLLPELNQQSSDNRRGVKRFYCPDGPRTPPRDFQREYSYKKPKRRLLSPPKERSYHAQPQSSHGLQFDPPMALKHKQLQPEQKEADSTALDCCFPALKISNSRACSSASTYSNSSNHVSSSGIQFQLSPELNTTNSQNSRNPSRNAEKRFKRKQEREKKRLLKESRKSKLRQEIQRYINAGVILENEQLLSFETVPKNSNEGLVPFKISKEKGEVVQKLKKLRRARMREVARLDKIVPQTVNYSSTTPPPPPEEPLPRSLANDYHHITPSGFIMFQQ